jgi:hypothetical protein
MQEQASKHITKIIQLGDDMEIKGYFATVRSGFL